jgi:hypothetical protein
MPRRVGSPKASVIADTVAVNEPVGIALPRCELLRFIPTPVFYLSA